MQEKFLALGQAHTVLTDPEKRREYDQFGKDYVEQKERGGGGGGGAGGAGGQHFQEFFSQMFGGGGGGGGHFKFEFGGGGGGGDDDGFFGGGNFGGFGGFGQQQQDLFTDPDSPVQLLDENSHENEVRLLGGILLSAHPLLIF